MNSYITIGGLGSRLKNISPIDKYLLYYKNKRIYEWILDIIPQAKLIGHNKTKNRKSTLSLIPQQTDILIIDCDIIPFEFNINKINTNNDCIFVFHSCINKYGSLSVDSNNKVIGCSEKNNISNIKCSGIYYIKNLSKTISNMTDPNSIASGMIGSDIIYENTFKRLGDIEDYMSAIEFV
jgi:hypothetical protein